jgi:pectate lyase
MIRNLKRGAPGVAMLALGAQSTLAQLPAFSGADGAGAFATGGRGGVVYRVTKLDKNYSDAGPGTLRYGLSDANFTVNGVVTPRTIVFDVAGTFWLGRYGAERGHDNGWDSNSRYNLGSNVTLAGQTAPGAVNIMGGLIKASGTNAIVRNITIAPGYGMRGFSKPEDGVFPTPGDFPDSYVYDAIDISGKNLMFDHITAVYATDETISANETADKITIQYSNISQSQNYPQGDAEAGQVRYTGHGLGSLLQAGSNMAISVHHNLYAHHKGRLPRVGSEVGTGAYNDFRNNVFYNWFDTAGTGASGQPSYNNFVGNFYRAGPGGDPSPAAPASSADRTPPARASTTPAT